MKFVTVATHSTPDFEIFKKSAEQHRLSFDILGWGQEYTSHMCKSIWLIEYLEQLDEEEVVLYSDGYDAIFLADENEILEKFRKLDHPVVYSAEQNLNMDGGFLHKLRTYMKLKKGRKPYQFLNAGQWIGKAGAVLEIIRETVESDEFDSENLNDQGLLIELMAKNPEAIRLDSENLIFSCTAGRTGLEKKDYSIKNDRIFNSVTGTEPCSVHFAAKNFVGANWMIDQISYLKAYTFESETPKYTWYSFKNRIIDLTCRDNFLFHLVLHSLIILLAIILAGYFFFYFS
jgi:hypothetical protein